MGRKETLFTKLTGLAFIVTLMVVAIASLLGQSASAAQVGTYRQSDAPNLTPTLPPTLTPTPACPPATIPVAIVNFAFNPQVLNISLGQTVMWTNTTVTAAHSTTSDSLVWDSGQLAPNQSFSFTFNSPGSYPYHCRLHPTMTGTVNVSTSCAPASPTATRTPSVTPTPTCPPSTAPVAIQGFAYNPQVLIINQGQTVRWTNLDPAQHTATSDTSLWDSGGLLQNQFYEYLFTVPGDYHYHCRNHGTSMIGTIRVLAGCAPPSSPTNTPTSTRTYTATPVPTVQTCHQSLINIIDRGPNPTDTPGPGFPYPSNLNINGVPGLVSNVRVLVNDINHRKPDDLDMLLVAPNGQKVLLMSDAGGGFYINNVTLAFDDSGAPLPDNAQINTAIYHPGNYVGNDGSPDYFNPPAPAGPYSTSLSTFNGMDPNGTWKLYVQDDENGDPGTILDGWCLQITYIPTGNTPTATRTPTATPTRHIIVHVNWPNLPSPPHPRWSQPISVTMKMGELEINFPSLRTDDYGFVSYTLPTLPGGIYDIRVKGPRSLGKADIVGFDPQPDPPVQPFQVDMGLQEKGDASDDNVVSTSDFNILKNAFGRFTDLRPDFDNNGLVDVTDFNMLKGNFGQSGDPEI